MENWTITPIGFYSTSATRAFGSYVVTVVASPQGGIWRIDAGGIEIARSTGPLGAKTIDAAIERATTQIKALIDALAPFSALAVEAARLQAEAAHADEVVASTRALLTEAEAALARQEMQIAYLEGLRIGHEISLECAQSRHDDAQARIEVLEAKADADADTETARRLNRYLRRAEMAVMGPEDADEEGGQ